MRIQIIEHNPLLKKPLLTILETCAKAKEIDRASVEKEAHEKWPGNCRISPSSSIDTLVATKALEETILVDGNPYEGTLEDLQLDPEIADDAVAESRLRITDDGRELLESYAPERTLRALLDDKPQYAPVFKVVLNACCIEGGCSRSSLESAIEAALPDEAKSETSGKRIYPQYFLDALETAGGIAWNGSWRTTQAGASALTE